MATSWADKYNSLIKKTLGVENNKEWRMNLEEHKTKGTLQMNVRLFQNAVEAGKYEGPTKNGFIIPVNSVEDIEKFQNSLNQFLEEVKNILQD